MVSIVESMLNLKKCCTIIVIDCVLRGRIMSSGKFPSLIDISASSFVPELVSNDQVMHFDQLLANFVCCSWVEM